MTSHATRLAFLAARPLRRSQDPASFLQACRHISVSSWQPKSQDARVKIKADRLGQSVRCFSVTRNAQATVVVQNPRLDDDGENMTIEISERAAKRLRQITSSPAQKNTLVASSTSPESHLRVTVTSGGCHGFQYLMSLEDASKIDQEEDTIFTVDAAEGPGRAEVVMDLPSLELLRGSTIDFTTELIGSQFKIVGNPRATSSCGCGTSFDIE